MQGYLSVKDIMTAPAVTAYENTNVRALANMMKKHGVDAVIIVNKTKEPVGIVTEGDIVRRLVTRRTHLLFSKAKHIMTKPVEVTKGEIHLEDAARHMTSKRIKKLCVVNDTNKVVGVLTTADITKNASPLIEVLKEMIQTGFVGESFQEY